MSYFVEPNDVVLDAVTEKMSKDPQYADRYEAIKELRGIDDGTLHKGNEFRRVASLQGTLGDLAQVLNPDWLQNKRDFYRWLDANPQHCTYDRRRQGRADGQTTDGHGIFVPAMPWKQEA